MDNICPTCNLNLRERTTCTVCECCGTAVPIGTCRTCGSRGHRNSGYGHRSGECWTCHEMHFHAPSTSAIATSSALDRWYNSPAAQAELDRMVNHPGFMPKRQG